MIARVVDVACQQAFNVARELEDAINATLETEKFSAVAAISDCSMSFLGPDKTLLAAQDYFLSLSDAEQDEITRTPGHPARNSGTIYNSKDNPEVLLALRIAQVEFARRALPSLWQFSDEEKNFIKDRCNMAGVEVCHLGTPQIQNKLLARFPRFDAKRIGAAFSLV